MNEIQFKEASYTLTQIGFYLMSMGDTSLFGDTEVHRNIVSLLSQMALYLNHSIEEKKQLSTTSKICSKSNEEKRYITKRQVIELCHPFITEYALTQAIRTNDIPYLKRGSKYFFDELEVKDWIGKKRNSNGERVRTCQKFV